MVTRPRLDKQEMWEWIAPSPSAGTNQLVRAAARRGWSYAVWCAWTYLHDHDAAFDLMDAAVENVAAYVSRLDGCCTEERITCRLRSVLKRVAKQKAKKRRLEFPCGLLTDLENIISLQTQPSDLEQMIVVRDIVRRLSPQAKAILDWLTMGYSWRQIARHIGVDRMKLRRAYDREINSVVGMYWRR